MGKSAKVLLSLLVIAAAALLLWHSLPTGLWQTYFANGDIVTMESRYGADRLMEEQRHSLLGNAGRSYHNATLLYYPHLLLEIKYPIGGQVREGKLLWSLSEGELLFDTDRWEMTHGYSDALRAGAGADDYRLLQALAQHGGSATIDQLSQDLQLADEALEPLLGQARRKQLLVQKGPLVRLHFQYPRLMKVPHSAVTQQLVTVPYNHTQVLAPRYSAAAVETATLSAFGDELAIRSRTIVYLPVWRIEVLNSDGSLFTSHWNAISGKRMAAEAYP